MPAATPNSAGPAEVTGLPSAQAYARGMTEAYAGIVTRAEGFAAGLSGQGVHGPAVSAVVRAQELTAAASAAWAKASSALDRQNLVREAYMSAPDAGSKAFVTGATGPSPSDSAGHAAPRARQGTPDPLRVANRMVLGDGEQFAGSGSVKNDDGIMVLAAAVDTPAGRQVHLGVPIYEEEDKKEWRGAHAPAQATRVDEEDGLEYQVDTGADTTVILDAADAARLPAVVEDVVARATEVDKECRRVGKECDRLYDERARLEAQRFGGVAAGEEKISVDARVQHEEHLQERRRRDIDRAVDQLDPADRAAYDERQRKIDTAGRDAWEPGKEAEAAGVCGLTVDEFEEMRRLTRIPYQQRTRAQDQRLDELAHGGGNCLDPILPPLLAEQAALVCGLTVDEYREMARIEAIPKRNRAEYHNQGRRVRTDAEQARLDELDASPHGATGANKRKTEQLRGSYLSMLRAHHSAKTNLAFAREDQAAKEATAQPLDAATAAELKRVTAQLDEANTKYDVMAGWPSATAEIPARNGGALVIEAVQREEEGGVDYRVDRKPADAADDWSAGGGGDPYSTTAGGLRKVAKLAATLAG
ncbi:MAG: hypothetical protein V7603_5110 [Micromonosporaceae bacterium]